MRMPRWFTRLCARYVQRYMAKRPPDYVIGGADDPYLLRWWFIPRNKWFNIYFHHFMRSDTDEALHDHPWNNVSFVLDGSYNEMMPAFPDKWPEDRTMILKRRWPGDIVKRKATDPHAIILSKLFGGKESPVMSIFFTGPLLREWGFWCKQGWRHWKDFVVRRDGGNERGAGCE